MASSTWPGKLASAKHTSKLVDLSAEFSGMFRRDFIDLTPFLDDSVPFDDITRVQALLTAREEIRQEETSLRSQAVGEEDARRKLLASAYSIVRGIIDDIKFVGYQRLEEHSMRFFRARFPTATKIEFERKVKGQQIGGKAVVTTSVGTVTFFAKSHSNGWHRATSTHGATSLIDRAKRRVRPYELIAYDILDQLGLGCPVFFFGRDLSDLYIATIDAADGGAFIAASSLSSVDPLGQLVGLDQPESPQWQAFYEDIVLVRLLASAMDLSDLHADNYGIHVPTGSTVGRVRIIDFLVPKAGPSALNGNWATRFSPEDYSLAQPSTPVAFSKAWGRISSEAQAEADFCPLLGGRLASWETIVTHACSRVLRLLDELSSQDTITASDRDEYKSTVKQCETRLQRNLATIRRTTLVPAGHASLK